MQNDRLLINDQEVDLFDGTVIALTYQINNLAELQDRQANLSNRFKVPKTQANIALLGWSNLIQSTSDKPYLKLPAQVYKRGVQVIPNGYAIIESFSDSFNVTVYSGIIDFFDFIESRKLRDLDFSIYDHIWNNTNVVALRASTSGVKYPIINYGNLVNTNRDVDVKNLRPATFVHTIIDQIFTESPYKKGGDFFNDSNYKKLLLPFAEEKNTHTPEWVALQNVKAVKTSSQHFLSPILTPISFDDDTTLGFDPSNHWNDPAWSGDFLRIRLRITIDLVFNPGNILSSCDIVILQSGGTYPVLGIYPISGDGVHVIETEWIALERGYDFTFRFGSMPSSDQVDVLPGSMIETIEIDDETTYLSEWNVSRGLPEMSQKDFVKVIANQFALFFASDSYTKTMYVARMNDIVANIPYASNWSDKLDNNRKEWEINYRFNGYGQKNYLKYKRDTNDKEISEGLGDGYFLINDEHLTPENTQIELAFAASQMQQLLMGLNVPVIKKLNGDTFGISTTPRILIDDTQDITGDPINFNDIPILTIVRDTDIPLAYFQLPQKTFNLGFDNSLIRDYWQGLVDMLQNLKVFTGFFKLNCDDVARLNTVDENTGLPYWFTPIYIPQLSSYFYLNRIQNFTGNGLTKVELIRLGGGVACIPTFGNELLVDRTFPSPNTNWLLASPVGGSVTYGNPGVQYNNGGSTGIASVSQSFPGGYVASPVGKFQCKLTIEDMTQGSVYIDCGGGVPGIVRTANGAYTEIISSPGLIGLALVYWTDDFDGRVTFASVVPQLTC